MKTFKHLYEQITSFDNLCQAFRLARRGKRGRAAVAGFELNLESALLGPAGKARALRGGSWNNNDNNIRTAFRDYGNPSGSDAFSGFRCASPED